MASLAAFGCLLAVLTAGPPKSAPVVDDYTALLYHLDQPGAEAEDSGPFARQATVSGGKFVEGRFGQGLDPRQGGATVPYTATMNAGDQWTLEAWIRVDGPTDDIQRVAFRSGCYGLYLDKGGRSMTVFATIGGLWTSVRGPVPAKEWAHVAGTYDGETLRYWLNGEVKGEQTIRGRIVEAAGALEIGAERGGRRALNGVIDEVRLSLVAREEFDTPVRFTPTVQAVPAKLAEGGLRLVVPEVTMGRAAAPPKIDGRLDDPVWQTALELSLRDGPSDKSITATTSAKLAYDATNLLVGVTCSEPLMDKLLAGVTRADGPVWNDDCVELFLQPPGMPVHHLAINALGTVYDAEVKGNENPAWSSGATAAAAKDKTEWTVELAIPFAALGGAPTRPWRGNVARERKPVNELPSWAPVGGRFMSPGKFGIWRFGEQPTQPAAVSSTLIGQVLGADGKAMPGVPVSTVAGLGRTDGWGRFRVEGLPRGKNLVAVATPHYQPLAVEVELKQPSEQVVIAGLAPVDVNAVTFEVPATGQGFSVYATQPLDDPSFDAPPPAAWRNAPISMFAVAGEYEPFGADILADQALAKVTARVTPLTGPAGTIGETALDVRLIKRYLMRMHYSRPPEDVAPRSRYLLANAPFAMPAKTLRSVYVTVHVPAEAKPGVYSGELVLTADGREQKLPVKLEVLDLRLAPPAKRYSIYYSSNRPARSAEVVDQELADIREHGATHLLGHARIEYVKEGDEVKIDYASVIEDVEKQRALGFGGPFIIWDGFERLSGMTDGEEGQQFLALAKQAILGLRVIAQQRGWGEVVLTHMDEVLGRDRLDRYIRLAKALRQVPEQRIYITLHTRPVPEVAEMTKRIDPYADIRCLHGHSVDEWVAAGHDWAQFQQEMCGTGDELWCYYNLRGQPEGAEWARLTNGYWLWLTPITTHVPWAYNSWQGDPLDDRDGFDFGYAFPVDGQIISTRQWEAYREGVDDQRYLSTLEAELARCQKAGTKAPAVAAARQWLTDLRAKLTGLPLEPGQSAVVKAMLAAYTSRDYDQWRRQCAEHAMALQRLK